MQKLWRHFDAIEAQNQRIISNEIAIFAFSILGESTSFTWTNNKKFFYLFILIKRRKYSKRWISLNFTSGVIDILDSQPIGIYNIGQTDIKNEIMFDSSAKIFAKIAVALTHYEESIFE